MAKKNKRASLQELSLPELREAAGNLHRELYQLRNELALNRKLEKPHQLKAKRKERARVLTFLTQKQKAQQASGKET